MSDQTLLSGLCSICNINESKYRCPGCAARTCSLPCYKRHQQWAQCTGKRDPTKFVKKSQLVTPAGIDHDFNFLSGIERNLENAERAVSATGVEALTGFKYRGQSGGVNYHRLEAAGVKVIRAPQGLSRQRENKSHQSSTKKAKQNVVWTVEWFDENKRRVLTQTSSTAVVKDADPFRQHSHQHKGKKRKLGDGASQSTKSTQSQDVTDTTATKTNSSQPAQGDDQLESNVQELLPAPSGRRASPTTTTEQDIGLTDEQEDMAAAHMGTARNDESSPQSMDYESQQLFLLRPRTSSSRQVLIPLDQSLTLGESLNGRTVLEFPTIYTFPSALEKLPEEYMLEEEYITLEGEEQKEFDELIRELDPEILRRLKEDGPPRDNRKDEEVDSKRILDVLKQDLGGAL